MKRTVYLPDELAARVDEYLELHRGQTFSSLVQQVLAREVVPTHRPSILDLAGLVEESPDETVNRRPFGRIVPARDQEAILKLIGLVSVDAPRHVVPLEERQPEDQVIDDER